MARVKKSSRKDPSFRDMKADYYPVQRKVQIATGSQVANTTGAIVDVGRFLSVVNHRLYRQGKTYQVKIDFDNRTDTASGANQYDVYVLTDTWYVQKAWQLARSQYLRNTADERSNMSEQQIARWEDFRVTSGIAAGVTAIPYQFSNALAGANNTDGEFVTTEIVLEDGSTVRSFTWGTSPSASEFSILQEYDKSGDTDAKPSTSSSNKAYSGTEGMNESVMDGIQSKGDLPPYNATSFTDNIWVRVATLDNSGAANAGLAADSRMSTGFFNAPCGLVVIRPRIAHTFDGQLSMTVKSGDYKGVAAMNMGA